MLAVGEYTLGHVSDNLLKLSTAFAGGIGCTQDGMCGALSGGILIIGATHGRDRPDVDDGRCQALAARCHEQFLQTFGTTCCRELRQRYRPCSHLVERAARLLLEVVDAA